MQVTKAIFPVAGLGTRFLPATKANPKEMMPIVDKPLIQYAVEEAVSAGITELIFVTNSSKRAIEDHFDSNFELESNLLERGKWELLEIVRGILPEGVSCAYIRQNSPKGLGHAVWCAKKFVMDAPFAVLLADDLIDSDKKSCLQQMMDVFKETRSSIVAVEKIPKEETKKYGVVDVVSQEVVTRIQNIVEKPAPEKAPSNLGVVGRYILTPQIFTMIEKISQNQIGEIQRPVLEEIKTTSEIQLTDAIAQLLQEEKVFALQFQGKRYDCGSKLGYLEATIGYALKHPELAAQFKESLQSIVECMD